MGEATRLNEVVLAAEACRADFERYLDGDVEQLDGKCQSMTAGLAAKLAAAGIEAKCVVGMYLGASDSYVPDMSEWCQDAAKDYDREAGFCHWWLVCMGKIVDICVDQFHPEDREGWRLVICDVGDASYSEMVTQP